MFVYIWQHESVQSVLYLTHRCLITSYLPSQIRTASMFSGERLLIIFGFQLKYTVSWVFSLVTAPSLKLQAYAEKFQFIIFAALSGGMLNRNISHFDPNLPG